METVYDVYASRPNLLVPVRDLLRDDERVVGFAGDDCDSEYFFWFPLGHRRVVHFKTDHNQIPPGTDGIDAIVVSETGSRDRYGLTPRQLADKLGRQLDGSAPIRRLASHGETLWFILRPRGH
jgi:hypothetical protein